MPQGTREGANSSWQRPQLWAQAQGGLRVMQWQCVVGRVARLQVHTIHDIEEPSRRDDSGLFY